MFHLAIPARDIIVSVDFYKALGCTIGRTYPNSAIVDFFGHQLVLHKSNKIDKTPKMYPRHFGNIFLDRAEFLEMYKSVREEWIWQAMMCRHEGEPAEHNTFFLADPSKNLIEFKAYKDPEFILGLPRMLSKAALC